jgi:hypothetical protein
MKILTPQQVELEMKEQFSEDALTLCRQNKHLDDYCKIGALLTDESTCKTHLLTLNKALKDYAPIVQVNKNSTVELLKEKKGDVKKVQGEDFKKEFEAWQKEGANKTYHKKFNGLLSKVLQQQEDRFCFNGAVVDAQGGRQTTLTGFVKPEHFKSLLLEQGLHWKDPGARLTHGEFTHRIQWWIILAEKVKPSSKIYALENDPLKLYASLPMYELKSKDGKVMWDFLFDCFGNAPPKSDAFRTPDRLHTYLLNGEYPMLDLLGSVVRARQNKRLFMENRVVEGSAYEAYISWKMIKGGYDQTNVLEKVVYKNK